MRNLFIILVLLIGSSSGVAQKKKTITITGSVTGDTKGNNYILFYTNNTPLDSALIKDGHFSIELPFAETYMQILVTQFDMRVKIGYRPFPLLIDGTGNINIDMDIEKGFFDANISGSRTAVAYQNFQKQQTATYKKISDALIALYGKTYAPQNTPLATKINASRDSLTNLYIGAVAKKFIEEYNKDYAGVYVLYSSGRSVFSLQMLEDMLHTLSKSMQKTAEAKKLAAYISGVRNTTIGANVKNFELNDQDGKLVSFAQFKGKFVWIDFWASWCGPCKQAFPHMKELYAKYQDKGLEILGISADSKIEPWLKILPTLKNPWTQVWDNKNILSQFAVNAFPTSFLIDPQGKIILKEVGYEPNGASPMDKKLEEIFASKETIK